MPKKLTYEFVKEQFEKEGYVLLSKEYVTSRAKLEYICPEGHRHNVSWSNWKSKSVRCPYCTGRHRHNINEIKLLMNEEGYILLTKEYSSNKQYLSYKCPKEHLHKSRWDNWVSGHRCPYCAGQGKPTIEEIKTSFESEGYILLTTRYKNNRTKLKYICPNGHRSFTYWTNWKTLKNRCGFCARNVRHTIEFVRESFQKENYTLLSDFYINQKQKLHYECPNGHVHSITWTDWRNGGYRCPTCYFIRNSGSGNYAWQGGVSYESYCPIWKDKEYKEDIKARDGYKCLNPYCNGTSNKLVIHHIDYNKKECSPKNLITVCNSCNLKANIDREWHTAWYRAILNKRYNY